MEGKGFFNALFDLSFSEFITTKIIKLLYMLSIVGAGIGALVVMGGGMASSEGVGKLFFLILAPVLFIVYVIGARVWLELIIVIFKIAENTTKIASRDNPPQ
jgi:hypothetical protein